MRIVRGIAGLLGELLITIGVILVLFVGWQLFWTDVVSDADADQVVTTIEQDPTGPEWVQPKHAVLGDAFAIVRIPRFGAKFARPLYEGTTRDVLMRGIQNLSLGGFQGDVGLVGFIHRLRSVAPSTLDCIGVDGVGIHLTHQVGRVEHIHSTAYTQVQTIGCHAGALRPFEVGCGYIAALLFALAGQKCRLRCALAHSRIDISNGGLAGKLNLG